MSKKSDKMYEGSPKMGTDEKGRPAVTRGEKKKADTTQEGTDGIDPKMESYHKAAKERLELFHKHEKEQMLMMQSHMKEGSPQEEATESASEAKAEGDK